MRLLKRSRALIALTSQLAPGPVGRAAFDAFCTPDFDDVEELVRTSAGAARIMAEAEMRAIPHGAAHLVAYLWPAPSEGAPRALLAHGWRSRASHMAAFVRPLARAGYQVVAVDLPAHGESPGDRAHAPAFARAIQEVDAAVDGLDLIIGHSLGGLATALAVEGGPPLDRAISSRGVALLSAPAAADAMALRFAAGLGLGGRAQAACVAELERMGGRSADDFATGRLLQTFPGAVLLVHDADDRVAPVSDLSEIAALASQAEKLRTTGLGHEGVLASPAVLKATAAFAAKLPTPTTDAVSGAVSDQT